MTLADVPQPTPGPGQVLLRIEEAALRARGWYVMRGGPRLARLMDRSTFALRCPRVAVRGTGLGGIVEAVGQDLTRWKPSVDQHPDGRVLIRASVRLNLREEPLDVGFGVSPGRRRVSPRR
jgi:NADPH:quinone reductase-like Zn-dependent oxidoreductase